MNKLCKKSFAIVFSKANAARSRAIVILFLLTPTVLLASAYPQNVPSMSVLSGYNSSTMSLVGSFHLIGFYSGSTLGGGDFLWLSSSQTIGITPDGGIFIAPSDHAGTCSFGCLMRQVQNSTYSTDMWGIVADAITPQPLLQTAITAITSLPGSGTLQLAMPDSQCIAVNAPLTITKPINFTSSTKFRGCIMAIGLTAGQYILAADGTTGGSSSIGLRVSNIVLRANNSAPNGMLINNFSQSYFDVDYYNVVNQTTIESTGASPRSFDNRYIFHCETGCTGIGLNFVSFNGGGVHNFSDSNFAGSTAVVLDQNSFVNTLLMNGVDFEGCSTKAIDAFGSFNNWTISNSYFENCNNGTVANVNLSPTGTNSSLANAPNVQWGFVADNVRVNDNALHGSFMFIGGTTASNFTGGVALTNSKFFGLTAPVLACGGFGGSAFPNGTLKNNWSDWNSSTGSTTTCPTSSKGWSVVNNKCGPASALIDCGPQAPFISVGNSIIGGGTSGSIEYNNAGTLGELGAAGSGSVMLETDGTWTLADASGAALAITLKTCNYSIFGAHLVFYQCDVVYPTNTDVRNSALSYGGSPAINELPNSNGRSGIQINWTDSTAVNAFQLNTNTFTFYKTGGVAATNTDLSGKTIYFSGFFYKV